MRLVHPSGTASIVLAAVFALIVGACSGSGGGTGGASSAAPGDGASTASDGGTTTGSGDGTGTGGSGIGGTGPGGTDTGGIGTGGTGTGGTGTGGTGTGGTGTGAVLQGLAVSPASTAVPMGTTEAFTASATYSDGTRQDVSATATWTTSDTGIATIDASGLVTSRSTGVVTVNAAFQGLSASASLTVTSAILTAIAVTPTTVALPVGVSASLTATGLYSDHTSLDLTTQVTWATGDPAVATVTAAGRVSGVRAGATTVTASLGGASASAPVTVTAATLQSLAVTPGALSLPAGFSDRLTATGTFSDGTTQDVTVQATWTSSASAIAAVDASGHVTARVAGNATLTASLGGRSVAVPVTVTGASLVAVQVTPDLPSVPVGVKVGLTATGVFSDQTSRDLSGAVTWTIADASVATLSAAGAASGLRPGATTITATLGAASDSTILTVTPAVLTVVDVLPPALSIAKGTEGFLQATATYSDGFVADVTSQAVWTSDATAVSVVVDARGAVVTGNAVVDPANVRATFGGLSDAAAVTVTAATLTSIAVDPGSSALPVGLTQQLVATGTFSDQSTQDLTNEVTWTSSDSAVATVSATGLVTALRPGSATIAAAQLGASATSGVTVTSATMQGIDVTPATAKLAVGYKVQFTATARFSDGSTHDATAQALWASSSRSVLSISNAGNSKGLATGIAVGTVTVTATVGAVSGSATAQVAAVHLASIVITPASSTLTAGTRQRLTATGTFDDGSTLDVTGQCSWRSSNKRIARVSQAGVLTAAKRGSATITATCAGISGSTGVTVN